MANTTSYNYIQLYIHNTDIKMCSRQTHTQDIISTYTINYSLHNFYHAPIDNDDGYLYVHICTEVSIFKVH